jgi:hypothetical protein
MMICQINPYMSTWKRDKRLLIKLTGLVCSDAGSHYACRHQLLCTSILNGFGIQKMINTTGRRQTAPLLHGPDLLYG